MVFHEKEKLAVRWSCLSPDLFCFLPMEGNFALLVFINMFSTFTLNDSCKFQPQSEMCIHYLSYVFQLFLSLFGVLNLSTCFVHLHVEMARLYHLLSDVAVGLALKL